MSYKGTTTTQQDTGWGVIFRLNDLFKEVEILSPQGKYDDWNFKLDRIWSNLCYRNSFKIIKDKDNKKIVSIEFNEEDVEIKEYLDNQILKWKGEQTKARKLHPPEKEISQNKNWIIAKKKLYRAILMKEIWLRKYMHKLGLYLKETEHNPAGAMWGK